MVIALAGRRIDAADAPVARFPPGNEGKVRVRLGRVFEELAPTALVSSAACGADLLALEVAGAMGLRRVVVLPWGRERFRGLSVVDRGAGWGERYDRVIDEVEADGELSVLGIDDGDEAAYAATNEAILRRAIEVAGEPGGAGDAHEVIAVPVWDGKPRGPDDFTHRFLLAARTRGLEIREIRTL
jgi:hypothetical protein